MKSLGTRFQRPVCCFCHAILLYTLKYIQMLKSEAGIDIRFEYYRMGVLLVLNSPAVLRCLISYNKYRNTN